MKSCATHFASFLVQTWRVATKGNHIDGREENLATLPDSGSRRKSKLLMKRATLFSPDILRKGSRRRNQEICPDRL